jgi:hypothetical protein
MKLKALLLLAATLAAVCGASAAGCAASAPASSRAPAGPAVLVGESAGTGRRFVGSAGCRACHPAAAERWRATRHALDFAGLPEGDRQRTACLRCHVTGYGEPWGYRDPALAAELSSVGCEACHGAGADHARSAHPGLIPTATGGECPPCEVNRICRLCHTPQHSPDFDLARDVPKVSCTSPSPAR